MCSTTRLLISTFPPFPTLSLALPSDTVLSDALELIREHNPDLPSSLSLSLNRGVLPSLDSPLAVLHGNDSQDAPNLVNLRLVPRMLGGKGGFGSQLRAAGGRMSSQKTSNNDSCRDLNGRRLSTIKEAKKLAEYVENEPARKRAQAEAQKAKLEKLEKKLGIEPRASGSSSAGSSSEARPAPPDGTSTPPVLAGKKHRFDDTEYLEQSRELVDGVKSAVSAALLKKRNKAKTTTTNKESKPAESAKSITEKVLESPATAPVAAAASVVAASVGA
ncbi:hypothetical protein HGRIS_003630 [Hohenbuehelia grisea]|uniref:Sde2 N-terminal ubiquitin domain-containing protein n=1 Tax=Hohenbuehelia grisea TaxID=104357 RepID=A0ABR3JGI4_9AGAR